ncbi:hypothetical protein BMS3Abin16_00791 [archaeon BMS3Abin16]|nr:hypothetical protein BMS3Abin16_00791 [archaeon BMS3Abin16]
MTEIKILKEAGSFAENKDIAKRIREKKIMPALEAGNPLILDFEGVDSSTQSFIHVLISELIRTNGPNVLDEISFKNCNTTVEKIIKIVVYYMQDTI